MMEYDGIPFFHLVCAETQPLEALLSEPLAEGGAVRPNVHIITPGDHFSPRTGSAIPTVVHGLANGAGPSSARSIVAVARGTYPDRYASAEITEFDSTNPPGRYQRAIDVGTGKLGLPRIFSRRYLGRALSGQDQWPAALVLLHNAPQLVPLVHPTHRAVLYAHNMLFRTYPKREAAIVLRRASLIVCVSEALAADTRAALPSHIADRVVVVRNGVDTNAFRPAKHRDPRAHIHVIVVGRVTPEKGQDVVIDAMRSLNRDDISLTIVGSSGFDAAAPLTDFERKLRTASQALRIPVRFRPFVPRHDLPRLMQQADIVVVPSRWSEPWGLTVAEGLATGIPVIATRVGGIPETIGPAGILVDPDDAEELAAAIERLGDDNELRERLGEEGRAYAEAHDWRWARTQLDITLATLG